MIHIPWELGCMGGFLVFGSTWVSLVPQRPELPSSPVTAKGNNRHLTGLHRWGMVSSGLGVFHALPTHHIFKLLRAYQDIPLQQAKRSICIVSKGSMRDCVSVWDVCRGCVRVSVCVWGMGCGGVYVWAYVGGGGSKYMRRRKRFAYSLGE